MTIRLYIVKFIPQPTKYLKTKLKTNAQNNRQVPNKFLKSELTR